MRAGSVKTPARGSGAAFSARGHICHTKHRYVMETARFHLAFFLLGYISPGPARKNPPPGPICFLKQTSTGPVYGIGHFACNHEACQNLMTMTRR
jgi:hypothetical protein